MKYFKPASIFAAFALVAAAVWGGSVASASEIVIKHKQGEITLKEKPKKVLVFDLASLDTLAALGVDVTGVPGGPEPEYLSGFNDKKYLKVGTLFEPDYEAVNAAEPDLIIVAARSAAKYADLAKIAPTIDLSVDIKNFVPEAKANVRTLANIFDKKAQGEALLDKLEKSTADLKALAATKGKGLLFLTTGGKMSAFSQGSRFDMLYSVYGVVPAIQTAETGRHGQAISFEFILEQNPDWLFVLDRDAAVGREGPAAAQFLDNDVMRQTKAWKSGQIVYLNATSWYLVGNGITSMQGQVDQLIAAFSKK